MEVKNKKVNVLYCFTRAALHGRMFCGLGQADEWDSKKFEGRLVAASSETERLGSRRWWGNSNNAEYGDQLVFSNQPDKPDFIWHCLGS